MVIKRESPDVRPGTGPFVFPRLDTPPSGGVDRRDLARAGLLPIRRAAPETITRRGILVAQPGKPIRDIVTPAVIPRVRSRPATLPVAGLLPRALGVPRTTEVQMPHFFEGLGDIALEFARREFGPEPAGPSFAQPQPARGTVLEFPVQPGLQQQFVQPKKRRRRRRLLTATDKCDITYMQSTLSASQFKVWLANPSCFTKG